MTQQDQQRAFAAGAHKTVFVPYDESLLAHQEPVQAISEWQQYNDITGADSIWYELDLLNLELLELRRIEQEVKQHFYGRQMRIA